MQYKMRTDFTKPWAERLRMERARRSWSRADLAKKLQMAAVALGIGGIRGAASLRTYSRRWEAGEVLPDWKHQVLLAAAYGLSVGELFGPDTDPSIPPALLVATGGTVEVPNFAEAEDDEMRRREFVAWLTALSAGTTVLPETTRRLTLNHDHATDLLRTITTRDAATLREWRNIFVREEHALGGGLSLRAVVGQFSWALDHLETGVSGTPDALDEWRKATAELGATAGWMCNDAGKFQQARSLLVLSHQVGSTVERLPHMDSHQAHGLAQIARLSIDLGRPKTALSLVRHAQSLTDACSPTTRSKLHAVKARAYGALGDERGVRNELALADEEFGRTTAEDIVGEPWVYEWQTPAQRHYNHGAAWHLLMRVNPEAVSESTVSATAENFTASSAAWGAGEERTAVSARIRASTVLFHGGEADRAAELARQALPSLPALRSKRILDDVHGLTSAAAPYRRKPEVADLVHEMSALTA